MNGLALCAGIGGLELGVKRAYPTYTTVCYVEGEAYVAANLVALMERGWLAQAPIWSDVTTFDSEPWCGKVDIVTAGFPCQPFSAAGKQRHEDDPRHLWPAIARIVKAVEPAYVFLENVAIRAYVEPYRDLRAMGFDVSPPYACTAAELGAGHLRRRVFVLAYRGGVQQEGTKREEREWTADATSLDARGRQLPDEERRQEEREGAQGAAPSDTKDGRQGVWGAESSPNSRLSDWWASEPEVERVVHGVPDRVDRDRAIGNAVVPAQAAFAFNILMKERK